jgi:plasmid replication initiation protein
MPTPTDLVRKANALVPAMSKLGLMELRLMAFCIAHIRRDDTSLKPVEAAAKDISDLYEIDNDRIYGLIKDVMIGINSKPAEYAEENKKKISVWFTTIEYLEGEGKFLFHLNNHLAPYLLDLHGNFTSYRIKDVYQFKAASTWHIYEVLRQYKKQGKVEFYLEKFKALIGVSGSYPRFNNLKYKIIDPSIEEINDLSDIKVDWEKVTKGRRVESLRFFIVPNEETKTHREKVRDKVERAFPPQPPRNTDFARRLREEFKVSTKQADQLARLWESREDQAEKFLGRIKQDHEAGRVKSLGGLTFKILRDEGQKTFLPGV